MVSYVLSLTVPSNSSVCTSGSGENRVGEAVWSEPVTSAGKAGVLGIVDWTDTGVAAW